MTKEEAAMTRWALSDPMDMLVRMVSPSSATDGDRVRVEGCTVRGNLPGEGASLGSPPESWHFLGPESEMWCQVFCMSDMTQGFQPACEVGAL